MGLDNLDQNYFDPNFPGSNHPWGDNSNYEKWKKEQEYKRNTEVEIPKDSNNQSLTPSECYQICPKCNKKSLRKYDNKIEICGYCMTYSYNISSSKYYLKMIQDRLNANKSKLAQETNVKFTKNKNINYIQELKDLIEEDLEKLKNLKL